MNDNKNRTLGFDLMDELEPTEIKKASEGKVEVKVDIDFINTITNTITITAGA